MKKNKIYQGNCFEITQSFPKESFDLLIFDLPYNIGDSTKLTMQGNTIISNKDAWCDKFDDNMKEGDLFNFIESVGQMSKRLLKKKGSLFIFFDRYRPYFLYPLYEKFTIRNKLIFEKINPLPHFRKNNYRSSYEECYWFSNEKYNINFLSQSKMKNVFRGSIGGCEKQTKHPTEKYEWMISPIILRHSNEGDLIGDFFMGSGTTCVTAKKLRRKYIGIELNEEFYTMAKKRLKLTNSFRDLSSYRKENQSKIGKWI